MDIAKRKEYFNIPNYITFGRIASIIVIVLMMSFIGRGDEHIVLNKMWCFISALLFGLSSGSDLVDGFLARRWNIDSVVGKFLDPLADKLLMLTGLIMLAELRWMPAWLVILLLAREISITTLRGIAINEHVVIAASKWGKYKSAFASFGVAFLILHYNFFGIEWALIGWALFLVSVVLSITSGVSYVHHFFKAVIEKYKTPELL